MKKIRKIKSIRINYKRRIKKIDCSREKYYSGSIFLGKTQMEIANEIGISQAQVSRLEKMHCK